jgi:hypothetical protein
MNHNDNAWFAVLVGLVICVLAFWLLTDAIQFHRQ